jgi:hypothetical protein
MARKLPPHIGKITAAIVAAAVPLIIKAVTDAVQKRLAAKSKKSRSASRRPRRKKAVKTARKARATDGGATADSSS